MGSSGAVKARMVGGFGGMLGVGGGHPHHQGFIVALLFVIVNGILKALHIAPTHDPEHHTQHRLGGVLNHLV